MAKKSISRDQVDGTVPGRAVLVMADLVGDGQVMQQVITESETIVDPYRSAERLYDSIKDDWPTYGYSIIVNERARYLMTRGRMKALVGIDMDLDDYLEAS